MKHLVALSALVVFSTSFFLSGCSSPGSPISRIDANRAEYESWPIEVRQAILDGRVEKGMTPRQVEVAIGKPTKVEVKDGRKGTQEVWTYKRKSGGPMKGSSWSVGTYGVGVTTAPGGSYDDEYEVIFENEVVVSSDVPGVK